VWSCRHRPLCPPNGAAYLAQALSGGASRVVALHISGNRISRDDLPALLHLAGSSTTLETLSIARCGLEAEAILSLLSTIQLNADHRCRVSIDASSNPLGTLAYVGNPRSEEEKSESRFFLTHVMNPCTLI